MNPFNFDTIPLRIEDVLRAQGADPDVIRTRSPFLVKIAEKALFEYQHLIHPAALHRQLNIIEWRHETIIFEGGHKLKNKSLSQQLSGAKSVIAVICTIGPQLEEKASEIFQKDATLGLAIDGVGSAAVEALANAVCNQIEIQSARHGWQTTIPLSPGMIGWSVSEGQPFLFRILQPIKIGVELTSAGVMKPRKSLSMLIGVGASLNPQGRTCDYCAMRETCQYRDRYQ